MNYGIFKFATVRICALALGICLLFGVLCLAGSLTPADDATASGKNANEIGDKEEDVKAFLESFGWEVSDKPTVVKEITIPKGFDEVYTRYNEEIQKPGGYDLSAYAGMSAVLYSYEILNYPTEENVSANVLVHNGTVIGGDVCSSRLDGFMHGFTLPDGVILPTENQLND